MSAGKAQSVTAAGEPDGWEPGPGYFGEMDPRGPTRIVVSAPAHRLPEVHAALVRALQPPLSVLYRQKVDRRIPRPQAAPPRDFVGVELPPRAVLDALAAHARLVYEDARAEVWIRGALHEQIVLDTDGIVYCYPDDPAFRDALDRCGLAESQVQTMADRDYVKHWFHADADPHEDGFLADLGLQEVPHRKG